MTAVENYHAIAVFQQLCAVDGVYSSGVCGTFQFDARRKVQRHHATHIVLVVIAERLGHSMVLCFADVA